VDDSILIRLGVQLKNSENGGISVSVIIEHPLLVFFRCIFAFQPDPIVIEHSKFDFHAPDRCQITNSENTAVSDAVALNAETEELPFSLCGSKEETDQDSLGSILLLKPAYSKQFAQLVEAAQEGLRAGYEPDLCDEGVNGTYFFKNQNGKRIAVFKPQDEEGNSAKNPKNQSGQDDIQGKGGIHEGEASQREVAAYLLDKHHFFGVPATQMVSVSHPYFTKIPGASVAKIGSLQEYVDSDGCSENISVSAFPKKEVHKIGILDLQILNMDRHGGNILFQKNDDEEYKLTPIDHGFSLPDKTGLGNAWFDWLTWPQAKEEFDEETKQYVRNIDLEADMETLSRELGIRSECLKTMKITSTLLKKAVEKNLSLYDIGAMVCRTNDDQPSELEIMCAKAEEQANLDSSSHCDWEQCYFSYLCQQMDLKLAKQSCQ